MIINLNDRILGAPNFRYREFIKSDTALRLNIPNKPTDKQWNNIKSLSVNVLQPLRDYMSNTYTVSGLRITSGFRSVPLCLAIGSSKYSNHARGQAADIEPIDYNIKLFDIIEWMYFNCSFRELIAEYFPYGWIHVAYRKNANSGILKLKDKYHNYKKIDIDYLRRIYG